MTKLWVAPRVPKVEREEGRGPQQREHSCKLVRSSTGTIISGVVPKKRNPTHFN